MMDKIVCYMEMPYRIMAFVYTVQDCRYIFINEIYANKIDEAMLEYLSKKKYFILEHKN